MREYSGDVMTAVPPRFSRVYAQALHFGFQIREVLTSSTTLTFGERHNL